MTTTKTITVGSTEHVGFPEFNMVGVPAKIDTGADTGALHCTKISEETVNGVITLRFSPFDHPETTIACNEFTTKIVRSSNGGSTKRYFVSTTIVVQDKTYPIQISLADRTEMTWPVLIGKRFLVEHKMLVDVTREAQVLLVEKEQV